MTTSISTVTLTAQGNILPMGGINIVTPSSKNLFTIQKIPSGDVISELEQDIKPSEEWLGKIIYTLND